MEYSVVYSDDDAPAEAAGSAGGSFYTQPAYGEPGWEDGDYDDGT